ncbi:MAG: c-type cytochrome [Terracidiphilus sp.]
MLRNLFFIALVAAIVAGIGYADQSTSKVVVQVNKTSATSGKQMYVSYCAPCHGVDGTGNGPVAASLKQQPTDLANLTKNNGGKFPSEHVVSVLQFGAQNPAHGAPEMPVWGPVLGRMGSTYPQKDEAALRISKITRFLQSIQSK